MNYVRGHVEIFLFSLGERASFLGFGPGARARPQGGPARAAEAERNGSRKHELGRSWALITSTGAGQHA